MRPIRRIVLGMVAFLASCSSESNVTPEDDAATSSEVEGDVSADTSISDSSSEDAAAPETAGDTTLEDTTLEDTTEADSTVEDTEVEDSSTPDAGPSGVFCGTAPGDTTCAVGDICCFNTDLSVGVCKSALTSCASGSSRITCTGRADCPDGNVCCANRLMGSGRLLGTICDTTCKPIGASYTAAEVCSWLHPVAGECPSTKSCVNGGLPFGFCG